MEKEQRVRKLSSSIAAEDMKRNLSKIYGLLTKNGVNIGGYSPVYTQGL